MSSIDKAIIPAAGLGKRMHPISSYLPKPMLPLGKKPVLQHIVDEIRAAGIPEILIVARTEHRSIREYFESDPHITIDIDDSAGGPGEAVLEGEEFINGEPFLVVFSDAPLAGEDRGKVIKKMQEVFQQYRADAVMSIYPVPEEEAGSRGMVSVAEEVTDGLFSIEAIHEKPDSFSIPEPKASTCRYLFTPGLFEALRMAERDQGGELQLTSGVNQLLAESRDVLGLCLPDGIERHDTGNFQGYFQALKSFMPAET